MKKITSILTSTVIMGSTLISGSGVASASGGFVKRTSKVTGVGSMTTPTKFDKHLTPAWAPAKEYTVTQVVTRGSSINGNITSEGIKNLKLQFSYGKTVSTADMVGIHIPANPKKYSKLALKVKYKEQSYKENVTDEYWYSHSGTSYIKYTNSGKYSIPLDKTIFVKYQ